MRTPNGPRHHAPPHEQGMPPFCGCGASKKSGFRVGIVGKAGFYHSPMSPARYAPCSRQNCMVYTKWPSWPHIQNGPECACTQTATWYQCGAAPTHGPERICFRRVATANFEEGFLAPVLEQAQHPHLPGSYQIQPRKPPQACDRLPMPLPCLG